MTFVTRTFGDIRAVCACQHGTDTVRMKMQHTDVLNISCFSAVSDVGVGAGGRKEFGAG